MILCSNLCSNRIYPRRIGELCEKEGIIFILDASQSAGHIAIDIDKENRILRISDNGCGMTADELENNLGTIARSGSFNFKKENEKAVGLSCSLFL